MFDFSGPTLHSANAVVAMVPQIHNNMVVQYASYAGTYVCNTTFCPPCTTLYNLVQPCNNLAYNPVTIL